MEATSSETYSSYGIRDSVRGRQGKNFPCLCLFVLVSLRCQGEERSWLCCPAMPVGWGGAGPPWQRRQWLPSCRLLCSAALLLGRGSSTNAAGGELRAWLFPISLEGHAAARVAHHSNKVWAGKRGKTLLIMKGRSGKGAWQSLKCSL